MELNGLLPLLRRWVVVIALATGLALVVGWRASSSADEAYESKADVLVGPLNTDDDTMQASSALAQTYAQLATSETLLVRVSEETGVPVADLREGVRATANGTTRFLTIRARADDAETARAVAAAVTDDLVGQSREGAVRPEGQLRVIDPAEAPAQPVTPRSDLVLPLAALAGLLGSVALILLYEFVSDSAETASRVGEDTGITTLAVPRRRSPWSRARGRRQPDPLRVVATQVDLAAPEMRCVAVASTIDDDGTDRIAVALAEIWGERRPHVAVLDATGELLSTWSGSPLPDAPPSAAVTEDAARGLIDACTSEGTLVVVVTGSPASSTAALVWAHVADVTLLGVRRFQTRRTLVREAVGNLRATGAEVPFVLLHDGRLPGGSRSTERLPHAEIEVPLVAATEPEPPEAPSVRSGTARNGGARNGTPRNGASRKGGARTGTAGSGARSSRAGRADGGEARRR